MVLTWCLVRYLNTVDKSNQGLIKNAERKFANNLILIIFKMGEGKQKAPPLHPTNFSYLTSTNVGITE